MTSKDKDRTPHSSSASPKGEGSESDVHVLGDEIRPGPAVSSLATKAAGVAVLGLGASVVLGMLENDGFRRFSYAYLTAYMWGLAIGLGALFWVTLQHLVNAKWSIVLRRVGEILAGTAPVLGVLALPIVIPAFLGHDILYPWANHDRVHADHLLHHKAPYLNPTFFLIRFVVYFAFFTLLGRFFLKQSLAQDKSGGVEIAKRMQRVAGPAMILFGLALTFCAIDLLMSLEPSWFSTIFGVYYFASCVLAANSCLALAAMWLHKQGRLTRSITVEHLHDLGKMMFAFTVFWAYIGFSQFMLIWYANVPEETFWYKERFAGDWATVSTALLVLHFVVPFFGMLSRHVKRHKKALAFWAFWSLAVVYLDMYWLVMPAFGAEGLPFGPIEIGALVGIAGAVMAAAAFGARKVKNLIPVKDPRLPASLAFENI
ncbi:MAG: quinol:cytochrome C oxidoreductase [Pseudomonadota bacterium]|nr:MAG: quinol:cytochrome C oxidoreductase [Pseudomonadota bacterium]